MMQKCIHYKLWRIINLDNNNLNGSRTRMYRFWTIIVEIKISQYISLLISKVVLDIECMDYFCVCDVGAMSTALCIKIIARNNYYVLRFISLLTTIIYISILILLLLSSIACSFRLYVISGFPLFVRLFPCRADCPLYSKCERLWSYYYYTYFLWSTRAVQHTYTLHTQYLHLVIHVAFIYMYSIYLYDNQ